MTNNPIVYDTFGTPNWNNNNINNDHYAPFRQDYQLALPFYLNGDNTGGATIDQGLYLDISREKTYRFPMRTFGRYIQITITNSSGRIGVRNISINDTEAQRSTKAL